MILEKSGMLRFKKTALLFCCLISAAQLFPSITYAAESSLPKILGRAVFPDMEKTYTAMTTDADGNVYVCHLTESADLNASKNSFGPKHNGNWDIFISRLTSDLVVTATAYLGGSDQDRMSSIIIDSSGDLIITGYTASENFPVTHGTRNIPFDDRGSIFITRISSDLKKIKASTLLGQGEGLAVVSTDRQSYIIAGRTLDESLPQTEDSYDSTLNGSVDAFILEIDADLSEIQRATYLGGARIDWINALAINNAGEIVVGGLTASENFPVTADSYQSDGTDKVSNAFAAVFSPDLKRLQASSIIGGSRHDQILDIVIDSKNSILMTGQTDSTLFPTTMTIIDPQNYSSKIFLLRMSNHLEKIIDSRVIDGDAHEAGYSLAVDTPGNIYLAAETSSKTFSTLFGDKSSNDYKGGEHDIVIFKFTSNFNPLALHFIGGVKDDRNPVLAITSQHKLIIAGNSNSPEIISESEGYHFFIQFPAVNLLSP